MLAEIQLLEPSLIISSSSLILFIGFLSLIPLSHCLSLVLVPSAEDLRQLDDIGAVLIRQLLKGHGNSSRIGFMTTPPATKPRPVPQRPDFENMLQTDTACQA